jgi:type I restriction enzyme, S subunit
MVSSEILPKAFSVGYRSLDRWNVAFFRQVNWKWSEGIVKPIGRFLKRSQFKIECPPEQAPIIEKITFGGELSLLPTEKRSGYKGRLFRAEPGQLIYSKIRVKQGSVCIVPDNTHWLAVSSEYPVYSLDESRIEPVYLDLVLRSSAFKHYLEGLSHGGSTKTRIAPEEFEALNIPIPPINIQQKIVEYWKNTEEERKKTYKDILKLRAVAEDCLLNALKIFIPSPEKLEGKIVKNWKEFERWDIFFYRKDFFELDFQLSKLNASRIIDIARITSRPWKKENFPNGKFRYIEISSVTKDKGITGSKEVSVKNAPSRATTLIKEGDIILSTTRPYLGAFAIVCKRFDNCVCSSGFALIDWVNEKIIKKDFFLAFLKSQAGLRQLERRMTGGLYPAIVQDELNKIRIPIVSIAAQQKVLNKIQEIETTIEMKTDMAVKLTKKTKDELEQMILGLRSVEDI